MSHKTIVDYRAGRYPHLAFVEARRIYPAIVTLEDWYFFGLELPGRVGAAVQVGMEAAGLPVAWLDEMPYVILSVHEFEKAAGVINGAGVHEVIARKVQDPELRGWGFGAYCDHHYPEEVRNLTALFYDEYEAMFGNVS